MFSWGNGANGRLGAVFSDQLKGPNNKSSCLPRPIFGSLYSVSNLASHHWHTIVIAGQYNIQKNSTFISFKKHFLKNLNQMMFWMYSAFHQHAYTFCSKWALNWNFNSFWVFAFTEKILNQKTLKSRVSSPKCKYFEYFYRVLGESRCSITVIFYMMYSLHVDDIHESLCFR